MIGAGVSGDTTADGLRRLDRSVPPHTDLCIVALGANDLMQVISPSRIRQQLGDIVSRLLARRTAVLLCGMRSPPWAGAYGRAFDQVFVEVARAYCVTFYPFLLDGVALDPKFNLPDRIHPNAEGVEIIADRLAPFVVQALLARDAR